MSENFDNNVPFEEEEDIRITESTTTLFLKLLEDNRFIKYTDLIKDLLKNKKNFKRDSCTNNDEDIKKIKETQNDSNKIKLDVNNKKQKIKKKIINILKIIKIKYIQNKHLYLIK